MGPEGKRKLRLRNLSNDQLIELYDSELVLRLHNAKNLSDTRKILARFKIHLGNYPPSAELAKSFLAPYANRQPRTLSRYAQMVKAFMKWYGEPIEDLKIKVPKSIPKYTEDADIDQVRDAIANKKTHKGCVTRDLLLFDLDHQSGLRRGELSNLFVRDIHADFLEVRKGKGGKDRNVPLTASISVRLQNYIKDNRLKPDDRIFKLSPGSISNKIRHFADKAGISDLHTHSLRHKFATNLLEQGTNIRVVQDLMGHENLNTTQVYLSVTDKAKKEAIRQLDEPKDGGATKTGAGGHRDLNKTFEVATQLVAKAVPYSPPYPQPFWMNETESYPFTLELENDNILLESIVVRSSYPDGAYKLMLFESAPPDNPRNWENEDLIQMKEKIRRRVFTHYFATGSSPYTDQDKSRKLHCGMVLSRRPLPFLPSQDPKLQKGFYKKEVVFTISVKYKQR